MREDRDVTVIETGSGAGLRWFLVGAAMGAALGLLFAPERGEVTREDLARHGRRLRRRAAEAIDDFGDELGDRGKQIRETVEDLADGVRDGKRRVAREVATTRDDLERRLEAARSRARAAVGGDAEEAVEDDDSAV
ncbi:MAG: YtxH domain-containing protein [Gemmatimonadales bacterium]